MKIYLDNNAYNRPFDDLSIMRNRFEAEAVRTLLEMVEEGRVSLTSSFVVEVEHSRMKDEIRRERVRDFISLAQEYISSNPDTLERASALERDGFGAGDALHLAAAEYAGVDSFVTCDDKLARKARRMRLSPRVVSPQELIEEDIA